MYIHTYGEHSYKLCNWCVINFDNLIDTVISLEQEYLVLNENGSLSVTITTSDVTSQDVIVEVTITDGTATGRLHDACASQY